jgi:hypothetical protein
MNLLSRADFHGYGTYALAIMVVSFLMTWYFVLPQGAASILGSLASIVLFVILAATTSDGGLNSLEMILLGLLVLFGYLGSSAALALRAYWKSDGLVAGMVGGALTIAPTVAYWVVVQLALNPL